MIYYNRLIPEHIKLVDLKFSTVHRGSIDLTNIISDDGARYRYALDFLVDRRDFNQPVGAWDMKSVEDISAMFVHLKKFNQPIGDWNVSTVIDMSFLFEKASKFNQPIGDWDTSEVVDMEGMFDGAYNFNQPIGTWDTSSLSNARYLFFDALNFDQDLSTWDFTNLDELEGAFENCPIREEFKPRGITCFTTTT